jgi:hypothetical protein
MFTPDEAAAIAPDQHHVQAHELTHEHEGAEVNANGTMGALTKFARLADGVRVALSIRQFGAPFDTVEHITLSDTIVVNRPAPPSPHDEQANAEAKTPEHIVWAREMAQIWDAINVHEGEIEGLKTSYAALEKKLMGYYELAGDTSVSFDNRLAYLKVSTYARYKDRPASEGGGKYVNADVVAALRKLGRVGDIKPHSVNANTLAAILREYRDAKKSVPPELDALVELDGNPKVVIGAPGRKRR